MARRNIQNDGDVKTWIKTKFGSNPESPTLKEFLTLYFFRHPLAFSNQIVGTSGTQGCNIQISISKVGAEFIEAGRIAVTFPTT